MIQGIRRAAYNTTKYVPGKTTDAVIMEYGIPTDKVVKLGSNENNYAPFPSVLKIMREELNRANIYPEKNYVRLKELLAKKLGLTPEWIALGHGAGNVLDTVAKTFLEEGDEVIIPRQSYGLYKDISTIMGAKVIFTELDENYCIDLEAIKDSITDKTKLVWLCNPNNPTGTVFDKSKLDDLINAMPSNGWIVIDEAYREFADQKLVPETIDLVKSNKNILCVRTFSKYYGLAGQRIGYLVAKPEVVEFYDTVSEPFNANRVGLAGAVQILESKCCEADAFLHKMIEDREWLTSSLRQIGCKVNKSHTNFLFIGVPCDAAKLNEELLKQGVIVRPCKGWGFNDHIRVSIGTHKENEEFLESMKQALSICRGE